MKKWWKNFMTPYQVATSEAVHINRKISNTENFAVLEIAIKAEPELVALIEQRVRREIYALMASGIQTATHSEETIPTIQPLRKVAH